MAEYCLTRLIVRIAWKGYCNTTKKHTQPALHCKNKTQVSQLAATFVM